MATELRPTSIERHRNAIFLSMKPRLVPPPRRNPANLPGRDGPFVVLETELFRLSPRLPDILADAYVKAFVERLWTVAA